MSDFSDFGPNPFQNENVQPFRGWTNPQHAFDKRQARRDAINNQRVAHWIQTGTAQIAIPNTAVSATGLAKAESIVPVGFTQTAIEMPIYSYGWSITDSSLVQTGAYPTLSAGVHDWVTQAAGKATLYAGASIGVVVEGTIGMIFVLHYTFTAMAITNFPDASNGMGSVS
jgi:hypothetical protein